MKRIIKIALAFILCLSFTLLTGCEFLTNVGDQLDCNHDYVLTSSTATCTKSGTDYYKCEKCGKEMSMKVDAKGHDYEVLEEVDSTCAQAGYKNVKCKNCNEETKQTIEKKAHQYELIDSKESTCSEKGYKLEKCKVCLEEHKTELELAEHKYGPWTETVAATSEHDGEAERVCENCTHKETMAVKYLEDMDLTIIKYNFEDKEKYTVNSFEELSLLFNSAILNLKSKVVCDLKFDSGDFNTMFDNLSKTKSIPFDYKVSASMKSGLLSGSELTMEFTYMEEPTQSTPQVKKYIQRESVNYQPITKTRSDDFDNFKINNAEYSYKVSSTEQLVYVLEHRVKPLPVAGSSAEDIYNKMKAVLRNIISDDMSDVEKIKAIHDWVIMNTTYDQELLELTESGNDNLKSYTGFYLEGVFNKQNAVCEGISKAVCCLANIEGIPCVRVSGHETKNPNGVGHAWNKVFIEGKWYILDATSDGTIIGGTHEVLSYAYFLISDEQMKLKYTGEEYLDYLCMSNYNIFESMNVKVNENTYNLNCKSVDELANVFRILKTISTSGVTIQANVDFDFGDDYSDELHQAAQKAGFFGTYSTITSGSLVMLVK